MSVYLRTVVLRIIKLLNYFHVFLISKPILTFNCEFPVKILVMNPQGCGDTIVMSPFMRALKQYFPNSSVTVVVSERGAEVLENCPYVNTLIIYGNKNYFSIIKQIRSMQVDLYFDSLVSLNSFKRLLFPLLTKSKCRIYFARGGFCGFLPHYEVEYTPKHAVDAYLALLTPLTDKKFSRQPAVFFSKQDISWADSVIKKLKVKRNVIVLHPYSENPNHLWPLEKWIILADILAETNLIIFTSPKYGWKYVNSIREKMRNSAEFIESIRFNQLAALISMCDLLISIDTSTIHIASATKTKTIAIYGPTISLFWGPLNKNQIVLQKNVVCKGKCREYDMNTIFGNIELCEKYDDNCINYVTEAEVIKEVYKLLDKTDKNE